MAERMTVSMRTKADAEEALRAIRETKRFGQFAIERVLTPIVRVASRFEFDVEAVRR